MSKKISIVFVSIIMLVFLFATPGQSEIEVDYDEFDETTTYSSIIRNIGPWAELSLSLIDVGDKDAIIPTLTFFIHEDKHLSDCALFEKRDLAIKIDGDIIRISCFATDRFFKSAFCVTVAIFGIMPQNAERIIEKIKKAEEITMRVFFKNKPDITWDAPDELLNEWKELFEKAGL